MTTTHIGILKQKEDHIVQLTKDVQLAEQQRDELMEEADKATRQRVHLLSDVFHSKCLTVLSHAILELPYMIV